MCCVFYIHNNSVIFIICYALMNFVKYDCSEIHMKFKADYVPNKKKELLIFSFVFMYIIFVD